MALSSSLRKVANKVVGKFGGDVSVRIITAGTYNTADGTINQSASDTTIKGVLSSVNASEVNELVEASDKRLTIAASAVTTAPTPKDQIVISSVVHQIIQVTTNEQDNTAITYELLLRA